MGTAFNYWNTGRPGGHHRPGGAYLNIYLATYSASRAPFIDYMELHGQRLCECRKRKRGRCRPPDRKCVATIDLGGEPEFCHADLDSGVIYQNLEDTCEVAVIDPQKRAVIQQDSADRYRVLENAPTHFGGHSVVVDPATHRIYVAYFGRVGVYEPTPR